MTSVKVHKVSICGWITAETKECWLSNSLPVTTCCFKNTGQTRRPDTLKGIKQDQRILPISEKCEAKVYI